MKLLITGTGGFIGQHLKKFYQDEFEIIEFIRGDSIKETLKMTKPELIINSAADIYNSDLMWESNVILVKEILEYGRVFGFSKFIQIGSSSEYGRKTGPSKETDYLSPETMYEGTKAAATMICQAYAHTYNLNIAVARPYSVYGPLEKPHRLFPRLAQSFINQVPMTLHQGYHDFIYIDDFVRGIDILLRSNEKFDIVNFGSGVQYSNVEIFSLFNNITGNTAPITIIDLMAKSFESSVWICDTMHAKNKYGFTANIEIECGIRKVLNALES